MASVNVRPDIALIHKLMDQAIACAAAGKPVTQFELTHDEIDGWRNQFDFPVPPVEVLCFRGIPIREVGNG